MSLKIAGYVLEPPRVAAANAPYTYTPNNLIADKAAWSAVYPDNAEPQPRADYLVLVLKDGSELIPPAPFLVNARFGWTKNEVVQRFDYFARDQRYETLGGAPPVNVGLVTADINTNRLKVMAPLQVWADAPYRLAVGLLPGITLALDIVVAFGSPAVGHVEVLAADGQLNWNPTDLVTYDGETVWFQRQQFYTSSESTGRIGALDGSTLSLNPLPATGQFPLLRIGFGLWLTPIEVGSPATGQVRWDPATGVLTFNATDIADNAGKSVYYDGVLFGYDLALPVHTLGDMPPSGSMVLPVCPAAGGDLIFRVIPGLLPFTMQFPVTTRLAAATDPIPGTFDPIGLAGYVQVQPTGAGTMNVLFSTADRALYTGAVVQCIEGDLPIEHGISMRFFRCPANLDASDNTVNDVSAFYHVVDATLADPIIGSPIVSLPALPIDGNSVNYPFVVSVEQGTGSFPSGDLTRLDGPMSVSTPGITLGYTVDFDSRQLTYGQRKNFDGTSVPYITLLIPAGAVQLPDTLLSSSYLDLQLETAPGSSTFVPLTLGTDALVDLLGGVVSFTTTAGTNVSTAGGGHAAFNGTALVDVLGAFAGVLPGDLVLIPSGNAKGVYTVAAVQHGALFDTITTDVASPMAATDVVYEIRRGREVLADRFWSEAQPLDPHTKVKRIRSLGVIPPTSPYLTLPLPFRNGSSVVFADTVTVITVPNDSKFSPSPATNVVEVSLLTGNLNLTRADVAAPRFRFGPSDFSASVVMVKDDSGFTPPASLLSKQVEISLATGACNFSQADFGVIAYWVRLLRRKLDYRLTAYLGFIDFTERMLTDEEALVTYVPLVNNEAQPAIAEPSTWIIRKELVPPRTATTNVVSFNPAGRRVARNPAPVVYRGGRPQDSSQVQIDTVNSTITFLPDKVFTDALPHGRNLGVNENVYIDYYVYNAVGGEKTTTVLQPPLALAIVTLIEDAPSFEVAGNQTSVYPAGYLLRVETDDVYLIGTSVYDTVADQTTITLAYGAVFRNGLNDPKLYVASGPTPLNGFPWNPAYFGTEMNSYDLLARGMSALAVSGDRTSVYRVGTVVAFSDAGASFFEPYLISGVSYDSTSDRTRITLTQNALRQYTTGTHILRYSVRPIFDEQTKQAQTSRTPILTQPYTFYRRLAGQPGQFPQSPADYTIDDSGVVKLSSVLLPTEEAVLLYTGHRIVPAGVRLKASYTSTIAPTKSNGLLDQKLDVSYWLYSPDTFYFRVEKLSNFQAEIAQQFQQEALSSSPSGGPNTSNASQPKLYEQGRGSLFFPEGHYANADIVMRAFLKFFNDATNYLEDVLQDMDGRIVGDMDGRFVFDGKTDNPARTTYASVTNQIDDILEVSPFPIVINHFVPLPPTFTYIGTYQKIYLPGRWSRFFPTFRASLSAGPTVQGINNGDEIADLKWTNLTGCDPVAFRRWPRASIVKDVPAGSTMIYVDNANGSADPVLRPPFGVGNVVVIRSTTHDYITEAAPVTVVGVNVPSDPPERIQVSAPLPAIPAGATVYLCTTGAHADPALKNYRVPTDVGVNYAGKFTFAKMYFPFDHTVPLVPDDLCIQEVGPNEYLQVNNVVCENILLAPYRFPALDGKPVTDCGDQAVPLISPSPIREMAYLPMELDAITAILSATLPTATISGGSLDFLTRKTITVASIPAPSLQQYDLVRITTGPNASAGWRRITSFTPTTIVVDTDFPVYDIGPFDFITTAGANVLAPALFTVISVSPMVIQVLGDVSATVKPEQTAVITNGSAAGTRRQITEVVVGAGPVTQLTLDAAFTVGTSNTFRVSKHLSTYGPLTDLATKSSGLLGVISTNDISPTTVSSEIKAIDRFFDGNPAQDTTGIFTDILTPPLATHPGTVSSNVLTRLDLVDLSVANTAHYVFIRSGSNMGIYSVASSTTTTINIADTFPVAGAVSYRVVSVFGFSKPGLSDVMCVLKLDELFIDSEAIFQALASTLVPVQTTPADPAAFATAMTTDALNAQVLTLTDRQTKLTTTTGASLPGTVSALMVSKEKLYDKRFVWIDARINRKSGQVALQLAAILDRQTKAIEQGNSLMKRVLMNKLVLPLPPTAAEQAAPPPPLCT